MNQEQINEKLGASAPAKDWIEDFVNSDDARFDGKTKDERIMMALGAYYAAQKNESVELEEAISQSGAQGMLRHELQNNDYKQMSSSDIQKVPYLKSIKKKIKNVLGSVKPDGSFASVYVVNYADGSWQHIRGNRVEYGVMKEGVVSDLEENAGYMETLHTKYKFLRRQADEAEEKYKKAKERNLDDDSLETYYTAVRTLNDRADDVYDAYVDARDKAKKNESVELEEIQENMNTSTITKITGSQIEKYLSNQDFKAIEQICKLMTKDELKTWSSNGYEGRTFELLMKSRKKNEGSVSLNFDREGEIPVTEGKKVADLKVGDSVRVTISSGTTDWSTGKTTRPEVTAKGTIVKIADTEQSVHAGDIAKEYTVKYKSSLSGRTETSSFRHVTPLTEQKTTDCAIDDLEDAIEDQEAKKKKEKAEGEGTCKTEALDPVGKEDDDVDNDGDSDESDEYLKNRRKTVTKAIQNESKADEIKIGVRVTLRNGKVGKVTNVSSDKEIIDVKLNDGGDEVSVPIGKLSLFEEVEDLEEGVEEIKARVAKYSVGDKTNFGVIKSISSTSIEFKSKDLPVTKIAFNQRKMGSKDFVLDRLSRMNESFTEARDLKIAQLALRSDGSGKLEDFVKNYSVVGKSILQIKEEYATFLKANKKQEEEGIQNYP